MSTENETIEQPPDPSEPDVPTRTRGVTSFLRFILGWYVVVFAAAILFWVVRWPFYDDSILLFLWGALLYGSVSFAAVGICLLIFLLGIKYKIIGGALLVLIALGTLSRCDSGSERACMETRYFSTCE